MGLFTAHKMKVYKNEMIHDSKKQVTSGYVLIATDISCRITGTDNRDSVLFVQKIHYNKIPGGLHKNYKIEITSAGFTQDYQIINEPIWAGGASHHIEAEIGEFV